MMKQPGIVQINEEDSHCQACNWWGDVVYVAASTDEGGYLFFEQNGGLCAECFLAQLFEVE